MTKRCRYTRLGRPCGRKSEQTLIGYSAVTHTPSWRVMSDKRVRNSWSYCYECARRIANRCETIFLDNTEIKTERQSHRHPRRRLTY